MDSLARGEAADPIVLHDEDGQAFAFRPLRVLRDGADLFLVAEREGAGTLQVLAREDGRFVLVRDDAVLRRVALRLEILRRAMEGELVWVPSPPPRWASRSLRLPSSFSGHASPAEGRRTWPGSPP